MDPLSAGIGLASQAFKLIQANKDRRRAEDAQQREINARNVANARTERLAKSPQTDVYGNTTRYVEGKGFVSEASPIVQAILNAQTREQLSTLTEDAPKAREARNRKDARSRSASDQYERVFNEITSRYRKPQQEYEAEGVLSALESRSDVGNPVAAALVAQAIRSGDPDALSRLAAAGRGKGSVRNTIQAGKDEGFNRFAQRKSTQDQLDFGELGQLRGIANDTDGVSMPNSNLDSVLSGRSENAMRTLMQAVSNSGNSGSVRPSPSLDYSGLFDQIGATFAKDDSDPELEALLREAQMATARRTIAGEGNQPSAFRGNTGRLQLLQPL